MNKVNVYRTLRITELLLNFNNPRFNPVEHQTEVIASMIEDQGEKLVSLAKHILKHGLNPIDIILVRPQGQQFVVLEGNRRVTALKLLNQPELVPAKYVKIRKNFSKLNLQLDNSLLEQILCHVAQQSDYANEWVRLKHTGENEGAGTVHWNSQQASRFNNQIRGKIDQNIVFLDELKNNNQIPQEYKDGFVNIRKTNFDRLMGDPNVREILGLTKKEGKFSLEAGVNSYFLRVLEDLVSDKLAVRDIYYKEDRKKYIENIKFEVDSAKKHFSTEPESEKAYENEQSSKEERESERGSDNTNKDSTSSRNDNEDSKKTREQKFKSYPVNRKTMVPSNAKLTISHPRILKIFNELKTLDLDRFSNAAAVLFRVFIELSADAYISENIKDITVNNSLSSKINAITGDFGEKKIMSKHEMLAARRMSSSESQSSSVKTFHAYIHNKDYTPVAEDLKSAWDDLWPFIENIWR